MRGALSIDRDITDSATLSGDKFVVDLYNEALVQYAASNQTDDTVPAAHGILFEHARDTLVGARAVAADEEIVEMLSHADGSSASRNAAKRRREAQPALAPVPPLMQELGVDEREDSWQKRR